MATSRDAQAGWHIFRNSGYEADLDFINGELVRQGFDPVAMRMHNHYRKLHRYGYERYVPINQLDVETLKDPIWEGPLRSRYRTRSADLPVTLVYLTDSVVQVSGDIVEISPTEARLQFREKRSVSRLLAASPEGRSALITFTPDGEAQPVTVDLIQGDKRSLLVTVSFVGVIATAQLTGRQELPTADATTVFETADPHAPVLVLRHLHAWFEALDAARLICDELLAELDPTGHYMLPPPRIQELRLQSPLLITVSAAAAPLLMLLIVLMRMEQVRNMHHQGSITRGHAGIMAENARALRIKNDQEEFRNQVDRSVIVTQAIAAMRDAIGPDASAQVSEELTQRAAELVDRQLLPGLERLLDPDVKAINVHSELSPPQVPSGAAEPGEAEDGDTGAHV